MLVSLLVEGFFAQGIELPLPESVCRMGRSLSATGRRVKPQNSRSVRSGSEREVGRHSRMGSNHNVRHRNRGNSNGKATRVTSRVRNRRFNRAASRSGNSSAYTLLPTLREQAVQTKHQQQESTTLSKQEQNYQSAVFDASRRATFRAIPKDPSSVNAMTGTTFWITHNGKKEIFGVVATHALAHVFLFSGMLGREFNAIVINGNVARTIPAKVVQFTPTTMGDLALVKFPAEFEQFLHPIELKGTELTTFPSKGYAQGYARNLLSKQTFPITGKTSVGTLLSQLPKAEVGDRVGLCGSPVFTTDFHLVGIHVGSSYKTNMGYIAPVSVLQNLITSYYNPGSKPQSIVLAGREIGRLAMDEYVASLELLNAQHQYLWKYDTHAKFSLSAAEEEIAKRPDVAFVRLTIGRASWTDEETSSYIVYDEIFNARTITTPWPSK